MRDMKINEIMPSLKRGGESSESAPYTCLTSVGLAGAGDSCDPTAWRLEVKAGELGKEA